MNQTQKWLRLYSGIITAICMILIAVAGFMFGVVPAVSKIIDIRDQSVALSQSIDVLRTKLRILDSSDENTFRTELNDLVAAVPSDKSLPSLFSTIDGLSALSGVTVTDLALARPGALATGSGVTVITSEEKQLGSNLLPFSVTITGSYNQIHDFLAQIVSVRRFLRVRNFEISYTDQTTLSVHFGMDAFYVPIRQTIGAVETPLVTLSPKDQQLISEVSSMPLAGASAVAPTTSVPQNELTRPDPFSL